MASRVTICFVTYNTLINKTFEHEILENHDTCYFVFGKFHLMQI